MLLLLLNKPDSIDMEELSSFGSLFNDCSKWKISDLFDVGSGLLEERFLNYYINESGEKQEIGFIRMDFIRGIDDALELPEQRKKIERNLEEKSKKIREDKPTKSERTKALQKEIPFEKILRRDDFLISTRGEPKGISLLDYEYTLYNNLVPTHHFIVLRPKAALIRSNMISIELLHMMLKLIVEKIFKENYEEKIKEIKKHKQEQVSENKNIVRRSAASFFASVKVDEVKEKEICLPVSPIVQNLVLSKLKECEEEKRKAIMKLNFWQGKLFEKINLNA